MKKCLKCNYETNDKDEKYCPKCGELLKAKSNKKTVIVILIIIGVILLFSIMLGVIVGSFVGPKKEVTLSEFEDYMEKNSCEVIENNLSDLGVTIHEVKETDTCKYNMGLIKVNKSNRDNIYKQFVNEALDNTNITDRRETNDAINNYYSYAVYGDTYKVVILNKNTILVGQTEKGNRNVIDKVFEDFGNSDIIYTKNVLKAFTQVFYVILGILAILLIACLCNIFRKMNIKVYKALIPFYNIYILLKSITNKKWLRNILLIEYLLLLIIIISFNFLHVNSNINFLIFILFMVLYFILYINIAINLCRVFGKEKSFAILIVILPYIGIPVLAFGNNEYKNNIKERND